MDSGSHKNDGTEGLEVSLSPQDAPKVLEPTDFQEEGASSDISDGNDDATTQYSDSDMNDPSSVEESDSTDDSERFLFEAIYDNADGVYRCEKVGCGWEVAFGYCHGCLAKHMIEVRPSLLISHVGYPRSRLVVV